MVLKKTNFDLTKYIIEDEEFREFWYMLHKEYELSIDGLLRVTEMDFLMEGNPKDRLSVELREGIILPLCVIQQYALIKVEELKTGSPDDPRLEDYRHMVIRSSYGIINAGRNSA